MKKFALFNLAFIIAVSVVCASGNSDRIRGNGNTVISDRTMTTFEKIQITTAYSNHNGSDGKSIIRIHSSEEYRLSLTIDSNLNQYVEMNATNNVLKIETTRRLANDFIVDIYSPKISGISINAIGKVEIIDKINVPSFLVEITGAGEIDGNIECEIFSANINGAGKFTMIGASKDAEINISGACMFNGEDFKINNASIQISGAGTATIWAVDNLAANISGFGSIKYRGSPNTILGRSGFGSIKKM
ncbi:MAG: DUF2807 domain-containing protein [Treponema sp.]|nr:DUF2807 domain-containing protein [Treponema sp.]